LKKVLNQNHYGTPAMEDVKVGAKKGAPILGICNGFQILCEAGLLEGALTKNLSRQFQEEWVGLKNVSQKCFWAQDKTRTLKLPIAHSMGRFIAPEDVIKKMQDQDQIWLQYTQNPNGALMDIAGICNKEGKIAGLMPHPERAMHDWMGSFDGKNILAVLQ
jgi:phosphoribosylformylglycinamidine synthase